MSIYNELITLQSKKPREIINLTSQIKAAMEKSTFKDGIAVITSLHSNSAVIVNDEEPGFLEDLDEWLARLAPADAGYKHKGRFESSSSAHLQALLLHHQVVVPFTEGRLDLGPWQFILYVELDGLRPKRLLVKLIGE
jgi:secondary thiamine-phosphate synthase enzyme